LSKLNQVSLSKKLLSNPEDRKIFGALIVIAANAGGAWTPIGDVTTTMLWINGQISAFPTMTTLFLPSIVSVLLSTAILQREIPENEEVGEAQEQTVLAPRGKLVFGVGLASLLSVPIFKATTGLPPYLGILASLGMYSIDKNNNIFRTLLKKCLFFVSLYLTFL
jgi:Na+/H+ antiporter NhaD/arsenite permease-like protein